LADDQVKQLSAAILSVLEQRRAEVTICPSDIARAAAPNSWRRLMPLVREAAVGLAERNLIEITQRGRVVDGRITRGPIRLRRPLLP